MGGYAVLSAWYCKVNKKITFFDRNIGIYMNIIVTGASRGIGYELVKLFAAQGPNQVIAISRNSEKLQTLRSECALSYPQSKVIPVVLDLSSENELLALPEKLKKEIASIDLLINNAGAIVNKPFLEISPADLSYVYGVNVFSVVRLIQLLMPLMSENKRSHVVNISSIGGFQGSLKFAGLASYSSSKAALACLTECLAEEFKDRNIAFNCLALGAAQTEMLNEAFPGYKAPLSALEMAKFIENFALNAHLYMNGKIVPVSMSNP